MGNPIIVVNENPSADARIAAVMNMPLMFRCYQFDKADSHGTTPAYASGYVLPLTPDMAVAMGQLTDLKKETQHNDTTANSIILQRLYLLPKHEGLTVAGYMAVVGLTLRTTSTAYVQYIDSVDAVLVKVQANGTEVALDTATNAAVFSTASGSEVPTTYAISANLASPVAIANTERVGIRLVVRGHKTGASEKCVVNIGGTAGNGIIGVMLA